jgi:UDP-glucose 4-epimerase
VVVRLMKQYGVASIVFSSSATVYGPRHQAPLKETMQPLAATNPYGRTKLMIEEILQDVCAADKTFQAVLLRYFNPIGAHPSGEIGESPKGVPNNLMPYVLQVASGKLPLLHVYGTDYQTKDGTCERDFIHVMDLADGHVAALGLRDRGATVINLGTGKPTSVKQLIACVERAADKKIAHQVEGRRGGDLAAVYADVSKAEKLLGWRATRSLDDACRDGWKWQAANVRGFE